MERRSVVEYLEHFLRRGRECAYVQRRGYRTERWSYRQVAEAAFRFARELEKRGIGKGERVLVWGPNSAEYGWLCSSVARCVARSLFLSTKQARQSSPSVSISK